MRTFLLVAGFFCFLLSASCQSNIRCASYTDFDEIDHYYINISEEAVWNAAEYSHSSEPKSRQFDILVQDALSSLTDTPLLSQLPGLHFEHKSLSGSQLHKIKALFCSQRNKDELTTTSCIAVYRDILVFKKAGTIVGLAKLCFDCDKSMISGLQSEDLGTSLNYQQLYAVLH